VQSDNRTKKLSEIKQYHKNPRKLSDNQYQLLKRDLKELGDLSGIIHNIRTNEIIGGNQRSKIFDEAEITITEKFEKPTKQGTIALGYVIWNNEKYSYRQVDWNEKQSEKANIVANKAGGDWDMDILTSEFEIDDLLDFGFEEIDFGLGEEENKEPKDLSNNLDETYEVVVECISEREQEKIYNQLTSDGYKCRLLTL